MSGYSLEPLRRAPNTTVAGRAISPGQRRFILPRLTFAPLRPQLANRSGGFRELDVPFVANALHGPARLPF
jgi:hypothetical protein